MSSLIGNFVRKSFMPSRLSIGLGISFKRVQVNTVFPLQRSLLNQPNACSTRFSSSLSSILGRELKEEQEMFPGMPDDLKELHSKIVKTITLKDEIGSGTTNIVAHFNSAPAGEKISVEFTAGVEQNEFGGDDIDENDLRTEEDEDEQYEGGMTGPPEKMFVVTVSKGSEKVVFSCLACGDGFNIQGIVHLPAGTEMSEETYEGPQFDELEESLQEAFVDYLQARGISKDFSDWVVSYAEYKEQQEYMNWLKSVKVFIEKK